MITLRFGRREDIPALLAIYNYEVEYGTATFDLNPKTIDEWTKWFEAHSGGTHPLIVAEEAGKPIGYATLSPYREKEAYASTVELSVYVDPACRRRGAAGKLMEAAIDYAKNCDKIHTVISVITAGNEASVRLHEKFAFTCCGTMQEVGYKFGKPLGIVNYQLMV